MTNTDKYLIVREIVAQYDAAMLSAEAGECPAGMTEEQWEWAELADVIEQISQRAMGDIRDVVAAGEWSGCPLPDAECDHCGGCDTCPHKH